MRLENKYVLAVVGGTYCWCAKNLFFGGYKSDVRWWERTTVFLLQKNTNLKGILKIACNQQSSRYIYASSARIQPWEMKFNIFSSSFDARRFRKKLIVVNLKSLGSLGEYQIANYWSSLGGRFGPFLISWSILVVFQIVNIQFFDRRSRHGFSKL